MTDSQPGSPRPGNRLPPPSVRVHTRMVSRERRALAAFLVLAAVATLPALVLRPGPPPSAAAQRAPRPHEPSAAAAYVLSARRAAAAARQAELTAAFRHGVPAQVCARVPQYAAARRIEQQRNPALLRALDSVPGMPLVTRMERFSLGHSAWLGDGRVPDVFRFYGARMHPVGFEEMSPAVRRAIGVRPTGSVDSPPLLYTNRTGAVMVQGLPGGAVRLTLFCGAVDV